MAKRPEGEEESASPKPLNGGQPKLRGQVSARMLARVEQARDAVKEAQAEGRKHVSVTDPDARMMPEGCQKSVRECHSFGVAMDSGLIVGSETTAEASDAKRLVPLLERATEQEPLGVWALDADSGYYSGEIVGRLLEAGLDTCIPDSNTAGDVHRSRPIGATRDAGRGKVVFAYDADADCYRCPPGNTLVRQSRRMDYGQMVTTYRAKSDCRGCPLAWECLTQPQAKHRTLKVGDRHDLLEAARKRFSEPEHRARYRQRGPAVETVFGYLRAVLGYSRWLLRGDERVGAESTLFKVAYQTRKLHRRWAAAL
jgi:transposase